jgi:hypothetical protein
MAGVTRKAMKWTRVVGRLNRLLDRKLDRLRIPYIMLRSALDLFALLIIGGRTCLVFCPRKAGLDARVRGLSACRRN